MHGHATGRSDGIVARSRAGGALARAVELWGLAAAGTFIAHSVTYWVVFGNGPTRQAFLASTGHTYGRAAIAAAVAGGGWAAGGTAVRLFRLGLHGCTPASGPSARLRPLVALQVATFAVLEVGERLVAGAPIGRADTARLVAVGLVVQLVVALALMLVVRLVARSAHGLGLTVGRRSRQPVLRQPPRHAAPVSDALRSVLWWAGIGAGRAPPLSSS